MEENKQPEGAAENEVSATPAETGVENSEQTNSQAKPSRPTLRKNGRNRSAGSSNRSSAKQAEKCGEIEDFADFKEKLSGSNVDGYSEKSEKSQRRERGDFRKRDAESSADTETVKEETNPTQEREGPAFEQSKAKVRPIEVELHDRRLGTQNTPKKVEEGVVSYSSDCGDERLSLFARCKSFITSLFGKKKKNGKRYHKNWKHSDRKYHGKGKFDRHGHKGNFRHGKNRHSNFGRKYEGGNKGGAPKA